MTPEKLNELERLEKAATPGPWMVVPYRRRFHGEDPLFDDGVCHVLPESDPERLPILTIDRGDDHDADTRKHADVEAQFVADLRNSAAELIADSRKLRKLEEAARPFKRYADALTGINDVPDACPIATDPTRHRAYATVGDLRRLAALLDGAPE